LSGTPLRPALHRGLCPQGSSELRNTSIPDDDHVDAPRDRRSDRTEGPRKRTEPIRDVPGAIFGEDERVGNPVQQRSRLELQRIPPSHRSFRVGERHVLRIHVSDRRSTRRRVAVSKDTVHVRFKELIDGGHKK